MGLSKGNQERTSNEPVVLRVSYLANSGGVDVFSRDNHAGKHADKHADKEYMETQRPYDVHNGISNDGFVHDGATHSSHQKKKEAGAHVQFSAIEQPLKPAENGINGGPPDHTATNSAGGANDGVPRVVPRVYARRWIMVFLFALYSLSNAYQWIHLNIIGNIILRYYNESIPGSAYQQQVAIDWLSMLYMLAYIPLIFPATWLLDRKGLRIVGILGTLLNALGAWIKCTAVAPDRFGVLMGGQAVCAIAQIFILGIPARLAAVWFGPNEVSTATAIGVFGNQLGCAAGFLIPPLIVPNHDDLDVVGQRISYMMYGGAAVTTFFFILVIIVFKKAPPVPPSQAQAAIVEAFKDEDYFSSLKRLFLNKNFLLLMVTYGINTGSYYAIGTLLNPVVLYYFPNQEQHAGQIGLTLVVSGVAGSIIAGIWLDRTKLFKATTVAIYFLSFVGMVVFTFTLQVKVIWIAYLCAGGLGFFMTGYLPVGFEFAAEITYPESEGTSSGLLNAAAQTFGIALTLGMGALMNSQGTVAANLAVSAALFVGTIGTALIKSDLRRQQAGKDMFDRDESMCIEVNAETPTTEISKSESQAI